MSDKVGRNDPCPCGSGKKYKQCCMKKEAESVKYTASGKRKFKAKVIKLEENSLAIFNRSATIQQKEPDADVLQKLKFRMTNKDFRVKTESEEENLPFHSSSSEKPTEKETRLPAPDEPFKPTTDDFRTKSDEK